MGSACASLASGYSSRVNGLAGVSLVVSLSRAGSFRAPLSTFSETLASVSEGTHRGSGVGVLSDKPLGFREAGRILDRDTLLFEELDGLIERPVLVNGYRARIGGREKNGRRGPSAKGSG